MCMFRYSPARHLKHVGHLLEGQEGNALPVNSRRHDSRRHNRRRHNRRPHNRDCVGLTSPAKRGQRRSGLPFRRTQIQQIYE